MTVEVEPGTPDTGAVAFTVTPQLQSGCAKVVVLDRIEHGVEPEYCAHGRVTCWACDNWCWLGDKTFEIVKSGEVVPLCMECATTLIPRQKPIDRVEDHRRSAGPH